MSKTYTPGTRLTTTVYGVITVSENQEDNYGYLRAVMNEGSIGLFDESEITGVVVEAAPRYNVGDKVRFTESRGGYGPMVGSTGTIIEVLHEGRGYTVECPHTRGSGWSNLTFFEDEIAGLVEVEPLADWERELLGGPKSVYYRGFYSHNEDSGYRFWESNGEVVKANHGEPDSLASTTGWRSGHLTTDPFFRPYSDEDTRSSTQPDGGSEMNRKMDTVREAGERRRQKLIAHTHKLEAVIRDRNAEIETLRAALSKVAQVASNEAYKNIPMPTFPF